MSMHRYPSIMDLHPSTWTDEQKAIAVAVVVIAIMSIAGTLLDISFGARSVIAVFAGLIALIITSYLLTGSLLPPEEQPD